ncbi:MAG: hypothetical protein ACETWK_14655 [Candidatus Aminicenantaceae bacterium]
MSEYFSSHLPYSDRVGRVGDAVKRFKQRYSALWWEISTDFPQLAKTYNKKQQRKTENEVSRYVDEVSDKLREYSPDKDKQELWLEEFVAGFKEFGKKTLNMSNLYLDSVFKEGFINSTRMFIENVKRFDPTLEIEDIYQALRNVWIMNSLQIYFNLDLKHSDSIFAYSMIYPYTDNYIDDVSESLEAKLSLIGKLKNWLEGRHSPCSNSQEGKIFKLISIIERQYDRDLYPGVYQSLLAIFNAQIKSLIQQKKQSLPYEIDILDISFEKGGTSVLADGFLVNGNLDEDQADFCFGFGVFLQLTDDIQDMSQDKRNNHMSIFSQTAGKYHLDALANKLLNFIPEVVNVKLSKQTAGHKSLRELILENCYFLVLEAIGKNREYFSEEYVKRMQCHFPMRFSFLKELRKKMQEKILDKRRHVIDLDLISAFLLTAASRTISGR